MELKEKLKREIDSVPEEYLPQLEQYLATIKRGKRKRKKIKTLHLKGKYDHLPLRKIAWG